MALFVVVEAKEKLPGWPLSLMTSRWLNSPWKPKAILCAPWIQCRSSATVVLERMKVACGFWPKEKSPENADGLEGRKRRLPDVDSQGARVDAAGQRAADGAFSLVADDEAVQQMIVEGVCFRGESVLIENVGLILIGEVVFGIEDADQVELVEK